MYVINVLQILRLIFQVTSVFQPLVSSADPGVVTVWRSNWREDYKLKESSLLVPHYLGQALIFWCKSLNIGSDWIVSGRVVPLWLWTFLIMGDFWSLSHSGIDSLIWNLEYWYIMKICMPFSKLVLGKKLLENIRPIKLLPCQLGHVCQSETSS